MDEGRLQKVSHVQCGKLKPEDPAELKLVPELESEKSEGGIWMVTKEKMPESDIKAGLWSQEGRNYKD